MIIRFLITFFLSLSSTLLCCMEEKREESKGKEKILECASQVISRPLSQEIYAVFRSLPLNEEKMVRIAGDQIEEGSITQPAAYRLLGLDERGGRLELRAGSSHAVTPLGNIHFKVHGGERFPIDPGFEYAMLSFTRRLFPDLQLITPSSLIVLNNLNLSENGASDTCKIIQASATVIGKSVRQFIDDVREGRASYDDLDKASLSAFIIMCILTNPGDYKAENIMLQKRDDKWHFMGIDNDICFVRPVIKITGKTAVNKGLHHVGIKNVVYFLPIMQQAVDSSICKRIQEIDIADFIEGWLQELDEQNKRYESLVNSGYLTEQMMQEQGFKLYIKFSPGTVAQIYECLQAMKATLRDKPLITHAALLYALQPIVSLFYRAIDENKKIEKEYNDPLNEKVFHEIHGKRTKYSFEEFKYAHVNDSTYTVQDLVTLVHKLQNGQPVFKVLRKELMTDDDNRNQLPQEALEEFRRKRIADEQEKSGRSDLHDLVLSARVNEEDALNALIGYVKPDTNLEPADNEGLTPLDYAFTHGLTSLIKFFIDLGAGKTLDIPAAVAHYERLIQDNQLNPIMAGFFDRLERINPQFEWQKLLSKILLSAPGRKECRCTSFSGTRYLSQAACEQLWDARGTFIKRNVYGRRDNGWIIVDNKKIWVKRMPGVAGFEYAVNSLVEMLKGRADRFLEVIYCNDELFLLSLDVEGTNVQDDITAQQERNSFFQNDNPTCFQKLDPINLSKMITISMLINPEDGKFDNYIRTMDPDKKLDLVCIDSENAFVPPLARVKATRDVRVLVKCWLFFLDQMRLPIPASVRDYFINCNAHEYLSIWLKKLVKINSSLCNLVTLQQAKKLHENGCFIGVPFAKGMISTLYQRFINLQNILEQHKDNSNFTHEELFHLLQSDLAKHYQRGFAASDNVRRRFLTVAGDQYGRSKNGALLSTMSAQALLKSQDVPIEASLADAIKEERAIGPSQGLKELKKIQEQLRMRELGTDLSVFLTLETVGLKEEFLSHLDFGKYTHRQQQELFEQMRGIPWRSLTIRNSQTLTHSVLEQLDVSNLTKFEAPDCQAIDEEIVPILIHKSPNLGSLNLSGVRNLMRFSNRIGRAIEGGIFFALRRYHTINSLAHLALNGCDGLRNIGLALPRLVGLEACQCPQLSTVTLNCPMLRSLDLRSNPRLSDAGIENINCTNLRRLYVQGCPLISCSTIRELDPSFPVTFLKTAPEYFKELIALLLRQDPAFTTVHLGFNRVKDEEVHALCHALKINTVVKSLHLGVNSVSDEGLRSVADMLKTNQTLRSLDLGDTNASEHGWKAIVDVLPCNTSLTELKMTSREEQARNDETLLNDPGFLDRVPKFNE